MKDLEQITDTEIQALIDKTSNFLESPKAYPILDNYISNTAYSINQLIIENAAKDPSKQLSIYKTMAIGAGRSVFNALNAFYSLLKKDGILDGVAPKDITYEDIAAAVIRFDGKEKIASAKEYLSDLSMARPDTADLINRIVETAKKCYLEEVRLVREEMGEEDIKSSEACLKLVEAETLAGILTIYRSVEHAIDRLYYIRNKNNKTKI